MPPTDEQWKKLVRIVKKQQQAIDDLWQKVNDDFEAEVTLVDEAMEKLERNHRRLNRIEKRLEALEE